MHEIFSKAGRNNRHEEVQEVRRCRIRNRTHGRCVMTAPTAFAQEEGSADSVTQSSEGDNAEGEQSSEEPSSNLEESSDQLSSDLGSSEEDAAAEGEDSANGLSSDFSGSSEDDTTEEGEGSSQNEQLLLGAGILAAIAGGVASFLPQLQQYLPQA